MMLDVWVMLNGDNDIFLEGNDFMIFRFSDFMNFTNFTNFMNFMNFVYFMNFRWSKTILKY